jgi:hypothetical protein
MYARSVAMLAASCEKSGVGFSFTMTVNDSIITHARNQIANSFMLDSDIDTLLFVDSDIGFDPQAILKMVNDNPGFIGAPFPKKAINWQSVKDAFDAGVSVEEIEKHTGDFAVVFDKPTEISLDEPVECKRVGFAIVAITREFLEKIQPFVKKYIDHDGIEKHEYFYTGFTEEGNALSETYTFCDLANNNGLKTHIAPWVDVEHVGAYVFRGSFAERAILSSALLKNKNA